MSTPLFLLLGLTIATCVIAYWADNLGKKLGKKRVTLFGLRPRQTATLITMLSSVAIMFFTLAALLYVNTSLRRALLHYDEERAANVRLRDDNKTLLSDQIRLQSQKTQAQNDAAQAQNQAASAENATKTAKRDLKVTVAQLKYERANLKTAKFQEDLARKGERLANGRAQIAAQKLAANQQKLNTVNSKLNGANIRLSKLNIALGKTNLALAKANAGVAAAQEKQKNAENQAHKEAGKLLHETSTLLQEAARLEQQQKQLRESIQQLETDKNRLEQERNQLELVKNQFETSDPSIPAGWVFDARTITPRTSVEQTSKQLRELVESVSHAILESDSKSALRLVLPDGSKNLTRDEIIDSLAKFLAPFPVDVSVRLTSTRNHAQNETEIQAALVPVPARRVFARGKTLAETTVDGTQSDVRIFGQLFSLLSEAEGLARSSGVRPYLRPEKNEPFFFADTNERLFEALHQIQKMKSSVKVRLVADDDISAIDQLRVRFDVVTPEL